MIRNVRDNVEDNSPTAERAEAQDNTEQQAEELVEVAFTSVPPNSSRNDTLVVALDLIDCLHSPPPRIFFDYVVILQRLCSFLKIDSGIDFNTLFGLTNMANPPWFDFAFPEQSSDGYSVKNVTKPVFVGSDPDSSERIRNAANLARNKIFGFINSVNAFVSRARNAGFAPQNNPFVKAASYNVGRYQFKPIKITNEDAKEIVTNILAYKKLIEMDQKGQLNLGDMRNASQLSSVKLSLEGFGGSGDTTLDLAKLLPNADEIKKQKALESLAIFDFSKRNPKMMFTSFYSPDSIPKGIIIGWKKVPDAAGYIIIRRNIFDNTEIAYSIFNDEVNKHTEKLSEYVSTWILSFYDNITENVVCTFLDSDVAAHSYYVYRIKAFQIQNESPGKMFVTKTTPVRFTNKQKEVIKRELERLDPGSGTDTISPYPIISHYLFGTDKYDWVLAAINTRHSINRRDSKVITRQYSYLAAQLDFLFSQSDQGKFIVPVENDVKPILNNVDDSISRFGMNQVVKELLEETGTLFYFEGKDAKDNSLFSDIDFGDKSDSGLINTILSAIDPETLILNLNSLATNMSMLLEGRVASGTRLRNKENTITELQASDNFDSPSTSLASDNIKFFQKLSINDSMIDLTTAEGLGTLLRTIRIFSDIGPNKGVPVSVDPEVEVPDPITLDSTVSLPATSSGATKVINSSEKDLNTDASYLDKLNSLRKK